VTSISSGWPAFRRQLHGDSGSPLLPFALAAALLAVTALAAVVAPAAIRGPVALGSAGLAFICGYLIWPKPTLLVFALFVLFDLSLARWLTPELRHVDEIVVPALFVLAALRTKPWRRRLFEPLREGALLVLLGAGAASAIVNGVPPSVWVLGLALLAKVFAFLYVVTWHDFSGRDVRQLYPLVLGVALVVLGLSVFEILDVGAFRSLLNLSDVSVPRDGLPSIKSLLFRPVLFSWFTAFVALFLFAGYVVLRRWWLLLGAALFSVGTVLAGRRRGIVGSAIALLAGFAASVRASRSWRASLRAWWPVGGMVLLLGIVFLPALVGLVRLTLDDANASQQSTARVALYTTSVAIARDHFPLGVGPGRYGSGVSRDPYSPVYAQYGLDQIDGLSPDDSAFVSDTFWPRVLGETGVIGLGALLVFTAVLAFQTWRAAGAPQADALVRAFQLGAWMVLVQALTETLASSMFDSPPRIYLLFGAVGMSLALARPAPAQGRDVPDGA